MPLLSKMSLPSPSTTKCLVRAAEGPAVWVHRCHQSYEWQIGDNLAPTHSRPPERKQDQIGAVATGCIVKFLVGDKDSEGSTMCHGV